MKGVRIFYNAPPWQKPVIIEIHGPHWFPNDDTSLPTLASVKFNELKSRFNKELVDVYGVPVSQVDIEDMGKILMLSKNY